MAVEIKTTADHEEIKQWVEERRPPGLRKGTGEDNEAGVLRGTS